MTWAVDLAPYVLNPNMQLILNRVSWEKTSCFQSGLSHWPLNKQYGPCQDVALFYDSYLC